MLTFDKNKERWISLAMEMYQSMLLGYAYNIVREHEKAQDVVQDTFIKLCKADMEKVNIYLKAWLFKVCRNRAIEVLRKEKRMKPLADAILRKKATHEKSPDEIVEKNDQFSHALKLIEKLPEKQKEVVYLKFQGNLSYKEIGDIAEITSSNVGVILHTAMKTLRTQMLKEA